MAGKDEELKSFLNIKKPAGKSLVEFAEVIAVPLDGFYESVVNAVGLGRDTAGPGQNRYRSFRVDSRPVRWYREYRNATEELDFAGTEKKTAETLADQYRDRLRTMAASGQNDPAAVSRLEAELDRAREDFFAATERVYEARLQKELLERELQAAGYRLIRPELDANEEFNFRLESAVRVSDFAPVDVPADFDYSKDWAGLAKQLDAKLKQSLPKLSYDQFSKTLAEMASAEAHPELANYIGERKGQLTNLNDTRSKKMNELNGKITEWQRRIDEINQEKATYARLDAESYTEEEKEQIRTEHYRFVAWLGKLPSLSVVGNSSIRDDLSKWGATAKTWKDLVILYRQYETGGSKITKLYDYVNEWGQTHRSYRRDSKYRYYIKIYGPGGRSYGWLSVQMSWGSTVRSYQYGSDPEVSQEIPYFSVPRAVGSIIHRFFHATVSFCRMQIEAIQVELDKYKKNTDTESIEIGAIQAELAKTEDMLAARRRDFLTLWNDPYGLNLFKRLVYPPDADPLGEFLRNIQTTGDGMLGLRTYYFGFSSRGFYTENGVPLAQFLKSREKSPDTVVAVLPAFDEQGRITDEVVTAIVIDNFGIDPEKFITPGVSRVLKKQQTARTLLPSIKFVETYHTEIQWRGYGLGELSHTFNLFPGETKELVVTKKTRGLVKESAETDQAEATALKTSASFEDRLEGSLQEKESAAVERKKQRRGKRKDTEKRGLTFDRRDERTNKYDANVSAGYLDFFSVKVGAKGRKSAVSTSNFQKNRSFILSQELESETRNKASKNALSKKVQNIVHRTASETSRENKLEIKSARSWEFEESTEQAETIRLENPNAGRTVNYNFFQLQNLYGIATTLVDVKIVFDSGVEVVHGSGVNDIKVYELEDFGKIFAGLDDTPASILLAAIIVRQVLNHYAGSDLQSTGNGAIRLKGDAVADIPRIKKLHSLEPALFESEFPAILRYLKSIPFKFAPVPLTEEIEQAVNLSAYHLEAQVGLKPATEQYLEDRRDIETERQRALVEHMKQQAEDGVFFPEIPEGVTHVEMEEPGKVGRDF